MSSTISTSRPSITASRSFRIRTTPEDLVADPYDATAMKSTSQGTVQRPHQVGNEEDGALEHADQDQVSVPVVVRHFLRQLTHPAGEVVGWNEHLADRVVLGGHVPWMLIGFGRVVG